MMISLCFASNSNISIFHPIITKVSFFLLPIFCACVFVLMSLCSVYSMPFNSINNFFFLRWITIALCTRIELVRHYGISVNSNDIEEGRGKIRHAIYIFLFLWNAIFQEKIVLILRGLGKALLYFESQCLGLLNK